MISAQLASEKAPTAELTYELVYAKQADGQYHLSYEVRGGGSVFYIDCASGNII